MISIIIPAHNEEAVIGRCLSHITRDAHPGVMEIIVVCNGCTDATAEIARLFMTYVTVLEIDIASKAAALNVGDAHAVGFPRLYVDADVVLEMNSILEVCDVLDRRLALAASPKAVFDCRGRNWPIRAFYKVWSHLPYLCDDMIGVGVYALSKEGRSRFTNFPSIIADDEFVRLLFWPRERICVTSCSFTVFVPTQFSSIVKIMTRSRLGLLQLHNLYPNLIERAHKHNGREIVSLFMRRPHLWPGAILYIMVALLTRLLARRRFKRGEFDIWDRDDSSRQKA